MTSPPRPPDGAPPPWRPREFAVILALALVFAVFGFRQYTQRTIGTRAERLKADMRMLALAINTYQTEQGGYPPPAFAAAKPASRFDGRLSPALTTPVGYLNRLMEDPYAGDADRGPASPVTFQYLRRDDGITTGSDAVFDAFILRHLAPPASHVDYIFWSRGPDADADVVLDAGGAVRSLQYDPTNGGASDGDIIFFGPAIGFRRNPYAGTAAAGRGNLR